MKRFFKYFAVPVLALAAASCVQDPLEFDHEQRAFDTVGNMILVEAIMPQATAADEEIYIVGDFNGGESAIGNSAYLMTHSETIPSKWGVYLNPSVFQGGKTLADGFTFYSVDQGYERTPRGEAVKHTLGIGAGEWANVYVDKWAKFFEPATEPEPEKLPEHSGVRIYIIDQTGWDAIALYQWGAQNDLGGGWPGAQVAGTVTYGGQTLKYFDYGDEVFGLGQNLIFNNNNGGTQLADYGLTFADGVTDYFFIVTAEGVTPFDPADIGGSTDPRDAMKDASPWGIIGSIASTGNSWGADEPMVTDGTWHACLGLVLTATDEFKFRLNADWGTNFGGTFGAFGEPFDVTQDGSNILVPEDGTYDLFLNPGTAQVLIVKAGDPVSLPGGGTDGPDEPEPPVETTYDPVTVYILDNSGWDALYLYMWGDKELCGGWPGAEVPATTARIGSVDYRVLVVDDAEGRNETFIFNNNNGTQTSDDAVINATLSGEIFVSVDEAGAITLLDPRNPDIKILVNNQTNWKEIAVYAYGDAEAFGGWPGATPLGKETVGDVEYTVFGLPAEMAGKNINLIFNNNGGGQQLADFAITVPEDEMFLNINASYSVGPVDGNPRGADKKRVAVFVDDRTGWDALALYQWGDVNNLGGGWPGAQAGAIVTIGQTAWKVYFFEDALGLNQHLIFNNNGGGVQLADYDVTFSKNEYFLTVTADGVTEAEAPQTVLVFAQDKTGWDGLALYMWGDVNNLGGGWPGAAVSGSASINGTEAKVFVIDEALGKAENLIFNNNGGGTQLPDYALTFARNAYYLTVTDSGVSVF